MGSKYEAFPFDWLKENCNDRDIEEFLKCNDSELPYIYTKHLPDSDINDEIVTQEASDQMAASVLRLQDSLDKMIDRLDSIEKQLKQFQQQQLQQAQLPQYQSNSKSKIAKFTSTTTVNTLIFLGWPVLVFVALKMLDRRRIALTVQ